MRFKSILLSISAVAALSAGVAHASTNLVTNGDFETTTNGTNKQLSGADTSDTSRTTISGWSSSYNNNINDGGYNFVLDSAIAGTWDSAIWLKSPYTASANGGNIFASDELYYAGALSQTITGLTVGTTYALTFEYALAQQVGFDGTNSNNYWAATLGGTTLNTTALSIASGGFSGWYTATLYYTATSATEVLSFLANGPTAGAPPFLLLDNVSLSAVPEPSTWAMLLGGVGLMGLVARRRRAVAPCRP